MRSMLVRTCLLLLVTLIFPSTTQATTSVAPDFVPAIAKFPISADRTVPAIPAHMPAPAMSMGIGPGSHLLIEFDDEPNSIYACTASFIFKPAGTSTTRYLGAAGHCFVPPNKTATHGTGADYDRLRTHVKVCVSECDFGGETGFFIDGTTVDLGPVVYARQIQGNEPIGNDFGIVTIPSSLAGQIRTSLPVWRGPTSTSNQPATGTLVCLYGNGVGVGETFPTMARLGIAVNAGAANSWNSIMPSMKGDSGSAVVTCGQDAGGLHGFGAVGTLTHITVSVGFIAGTTVGRGIAMATQAGLTIQIVYGS